MSEETDLVGRSRAAAAQNQPTSRKVLDLRAKVEDLVTKITDLQGAVSVEQSRTQVEVTLAADVFFPFDKADLNPDAHAMFTVNAGDDCGSPNLNPSCRATFIPAPA